ncbi:MAG: toll/interleukin-1 receptor domain-containing protein [Bacteroidales bacterium]|nr:toll/interleukin-1 receptor domain-containing protein [Bacteroidales bacterium]
MQGKNFDIFISYRRSDGDKVARILDLAFKNDGYRCFLDYNSIEGGLFEQKIHVAIKDAPVFVMVMTPDYFKRCNEEGDWVRKEIELALKYEKTIIPISIDNIVDKVPTDLDEDFRARVGAHNFAIVYTNSTFDVTFKKMLDERIRKAKGVIQNARNKAKVKVMADVDCDLIRAGELIATLQAGEENLIYISGGQYTVEARSSEFPDIKEEIQIDINNVSFEYDFKIKLAKRVKPRRKKRDEEHKPWWERNKSKCVMLLAVIAGAVAGTWCIKNCKGTTETATETVVETPAIEQKEELFKQYVAKAEAFDLEYVENPDKENLLDSVRHYYELALELEENSEIRNRLKGL